MAAKDILVNYTEDMEVLEESVLQSIKNIHGRNVQIWTVLLLSRKNSVQKRRGLPSYRISKNIFTGKITSVDREEGGDDIQEPDEKVDHLDLLAQELQQVKNFEVLKEIVKLVSDLKEYVSYEVGKLRRNMVNDLVVHLKEENDFLKNEIKESQSLLRDVLLQDINKNNHEKIKNKSETNEWNENEQNNNNHYDAQPLTNNQSYAPPQLNKSIRRPNPVINLSPERDLLQHNIKSSETRKNKKKIRIISDSIAKGINTREFNNHLRNGEARFKVFPGSNIKNLLSTNLSR
ncbi:uncharacterized protein MAL13P1.304-like [Hydractinia symbiolongicarpus]|uniref:uncharacterized protein MAL13P1.304-like n=1 Tax=Hydractinia symbiolongicarpus TaxID=13093 RepID=UPI002550F8A4|nr:uncharacterized protein MAL13P1.304-like [Hydractinia symbiolongicarpus]